MTNVYIDNLSTSEAQKLFNAFADKNYLSNAECNLNGHNSSVRIECYGNKVYGDLAQYFLDKRNA